MEWIIRSVRTIPWRRSLTAGFDGIVLAALTVVAADVLFSPAVGALGGSGVLIAAGCAVAFSVVFAVLVQPLFWVIHLSVASVHARRSLAGITCAILALVPLLGPVLQLALKPGPMLFVLGGTGITAAIAAFTAVRISRCPGGVAISFLAGVRAVMAVADALDLSRRIRADVVGLPLLLFVVLMLALPVLAYVAGNAFDAVLRTERRSRLNFLFAGAGLILAVVTPRLFIGQYPALRLAAMGAAFVCLLPAVTGLSLFVGIRLRAGIGVIGLGGLGLLAVLPVTSPVPWSLSGQTVVTRSLLECSGFSALRFSELWNSLAEQQGAADGRQEDLSAQKWNQEPRSEVKVRNVILLTVDSIRVDHFPGRFFLLTLCNKAFQLTAFNSGSNFCANRFRAFR